MSNVYGRLVEFLDGIYDSKTIEEVSILIQYLIEVLNPIQVLFGGVSEEGQIAFLIIVNREISEEERVISGEAGKASVLAVTVSKNELTKEDIEDIKQLPVVYQAKAKTE